jgi:hypothetical protein
VLALLPVRLPCDQRSGSQSSAPTCDACLGLLLQPAQRLQASRVTQLCLVSGGRPDVVLPEEARALRVKNLVHALVAKVAIAVGIQGTCSTHEKQHFSYLAGPLKHAAVCQSQPLVASDRPGHVLNSKGGTSVPNL